MYTLGNLVQESTNQLTSVRNICANHNSHKVLLIVWLAFTGCCLVVLGIYICVQWVISKHGSMHITLWPCLLPLWAVVCGLFEAFSGLGQLAFYYYDLITSIIVLAQVWGSWPGDILATIFLFHFAITGVIVAFHGFIRIAGLKYDLSEAGVRSYALIVVFSLIAGPMMIPVVLVLDTCVFIRQVLLCIGRFVHLFGCQWVRPGYVVAVRVHRCLHASDYLGFSWIDLENYESMHNLIAAFLQSMPTVILNSVVFSLGNKPSHGIFLSSGLFVTAIIASCLAMLKCLIVILWQSSHSKLNPFRHAASLVVGKTLTGNKGQSLTPIRSVELLAQQYRVSASAPLGSPEQALHQPKHSPLADVAQDTV